MNIWTIDNFIFKPVNVDYMDHLRLKLTIDSSKIDEDLTDFPVLVTVSSGVGINNFDATVVFDELSFANRKKIIIKDANQNYLYTEIEQWVDDEEANLWIKVPTISSGTNKDLYLYYNNTQIENTTYIGDIGDTPAQSVWDDNFVGVWHMNQNPDAAYSIKDSTANANHGSPAGSMTPVDLVDGKIGKAIEFDGIDDRIVLPESLGRIITDDPHTLEATIFPVNNSATIEFLCFYYDSRYTFLLNNAGTFYYGYYNGSSWVRPTAAGYSFDSYHYAAGTKDGTNLRLYINDSLVDTKLMSGVPQELTSTDGNRIGTHASEVNPYRGKIDEVRISDTNRSDAWLKTTYYSNWDDLITYSSVITTEAREVRIYNKLTETLSGTIYCDAPNSVWADSDYLYIGTTNSGIIRSPISSISGAVYNDLNVYKNYPDISSEYVNYVHGNGNYLCVATISGAHIFDLTTNSGIYTNTSIVADKCHQLSDGTSYYIYEDKLRTVYNDNSTYLYTAGDGLIPTVSGINDVHVVSGTNNLILLATVNGVTIIEENKGNEANSRKKYYYLEE